MLDYGRTGLLVPPADPDAISEAISGLLEDPACAERLGEAAREKFFKEFTVNGMIERYERLYVSRLEQE